MFSQLRLWIDANHDGISQPEELLQLASKSITKLGLDYKESRRKDINGNEFRYRARVYDAQGATNGRWAWDVFFQPALSAPNTGMQRTLNGPSKLNQPVNSQ